MASTLRIGTRGSLLALAQARLVQARLTVASELVVVSTAGDLDRETPLDQMPTVGVFSRALDTALLAGDVDCVVHSAKDLALDRPKGVILAAVPARAPAHDVVLFRHDITERLRHGPITLGSSSPRRAASVAQALAWALPAPGGALGIRFVDLRGNVDSRVARLTLADGDPAGLDGVVLAFAGLSRLWADAAGRARLAPLLDNCRIMVLPLSLVPGAAGQGALAIECRANDATALARLAPLDHRPSRTSLALEKAALGDLGGGCRVASGVTAVTVSGVADPVLIGAGATSDQRGLWDGRDWQAALASVEALAPTLPDTEAAFVAHARAAPEGWQPPARLYTAGPATWRRLAARGHWVEGCADGLGFAALAPLLADPWLRLPSLADWLVLTHADAVDGWDEGRALATYKLHPKPVSDAVVTSLAAAERVYWASAAQARALRHLVPPGVAQFCGPGRTWDSLRPEMPDLRPLWPAPERVG